MHTAASPAKKVLERGGQCYDLASPADKVLERGAHCYVFKPRVQDVCGWRRNTATISGFATNMQSAASPG